MPPSVVSVIGLYVQGVFRPSVSRPIVLLEKVSIGQYAAITDSITSYHRLHLLREGPSIKYVTGRGVSGVLT